jgi:hypothetical protein
MTARDLSDVMSRHVCNACVSFHVSSSSYDTRNLLLVVMSRHVCNACVSFHGLDLPNSLVFYLSLSLSLARSLARSLSLSLSLSLSVCMSLSLSLSLSRFRSRSLSVCLSVCLSLSRSRARSHALSRSLALARSLAHSQWLSSQYQRQCASRAVAHVSGGEGEREAWRKTNTDVASPLQIISASELLCDP